MCNRLGLAFGVRVRLRVNKLDVNYNIVTSPLDRTLAIAALGYSGPESGRQRRRYKDTLKANLK